MLLKTKIFLLSLLIFSPIFFIHAENYLSISASSTFSRDLGLGNRGQDVENLQCILEVSTPTGYFGPITQGALVQFQNAHAADILTPAGLTQGTGYFGARTRAFINTQLAQKGATSTTPTCPTYVPPGSTPTPTPNPLPNPQPTPNPSPNPSPTPTSCPTGYSCTPTQPANCHIGYSCLPTQPTFNSYGLNGYGNISDPYNNPYSAYSPSINANAYTNPNISPLVGHASPNNQYAAYAEDVNPAELQAYLNHGWYYGKDNGGNDCRIDPVIEFLIEKVPKLFPWAQVNSSCRTQAYNNQVGGSPSSAHITGEAVDFGSQSGMSG